MFERKTAARWILLTVAAGLTVPSAARAAPSLFVSNFDGTTVSIVPPTGGTASTFTSGLSEPGALTFDAAGNLYVAEFNRNVVEKVAPDGTQSVFATGVNGPDGLAFDSAGNLYIADANGKAVSRVGPSGGVATTSFTTSFFPGSIAFDAGGRLYIADENGTSVYRAPAGGGTPSVFAAIATSTDGGLGGLAFDAAGNLYAAAFNGNYVDQVTPAGTVSTFATGVNGPNGLAFDAAGDLFIADAGTTVSEVGPAGGTATTFATGFNSPYGLAFAPVPEPSSAAMLIPAAVLAAGRFGRRGGRGRPAAGALNVARG